MKTKVTKMIKYVPNMKLLTTWLESKKFEPYPVAAIFEFDGKRLIYIGTQHNVIESKSPESFYAINYAFKKYNIDCVVTEFEHHWKSIEEKPFTNVGKEDMNELAYSVYVARSRNIPFVFADTNYADWIQDLGKISPDRAIKMQTMWILIDALKYKQAFNKNDNIKHALDIFRYKLSKFGYTMSLTADEFKKCCEMDFGCIVSDENLSDILNNFTNWDYPNLDGAMPNKIWAEIDLYSRDPYMINEIFKAINKYNTVLVTMGAGHYESQRLVFENAFGKPTYIHDFPPSERIDIIAPKIPFEQKSENQK
jgi:hypothetical protein